MGKKTKHRSHIKKQRKGNLNRQQKFESDGASKDINARGILWESIILISRMIIGLVLIAIGGYCTIKGYKDDNASLEIFGVSLHSTYIGLFLAFGGIVLIRNIKLDVVIKNQRD